MAEEATDKQAAGHGEGIARELARQNRAIAQLLRLHGRAMSEQSSMRRELELMKQRLKRLGTTK